MTSGAPSLAVAPVATPVAERAPVERAATISRRTPWRCPFAINGRFLSQTTTGVQRYAREITGALDATLARSNGRGRLLVPSGTAPPQPLAAIDVEAIGPLAGHLWEQITLPARAGLPLLNLCNTGPAAAAAQVVCMHDANVFVRPDSYSRAFRTAYQALLPWLARRAMRVATVSRAAAEQLAAVLPLRAADIAVLPNGHEHALRWTAAASTLAHRFDPIRPFVLLLGSRARHKNAALILGMAEALDALGLDLVVAGGSAGIFAEVGGATGGNVRSLGPVSDDDLAFLYKSALCLAFPSWTEGFGLPIVEAMALGCPVVSSDRASMPEVCGEAALMASPDDAPAWLAHIAALADSPALRDDLRGRGREQVRLFSWERSAQGYLDLFGVSA